MFKNVSLIAAAVIENIDHHCRNSGCMVKLSVTEKKSHIEVCDFRVVTCPAYNCKSMMAYSDLVHHLLNQCKYSTAKDQGVREITSPSYTKFDYVYLKDEVIEGIRWSTNVKTVLWKNKFFFLNTQKLFGNLWNMYVQMLGTKEESSKYTVNISMEEDFMFGYSGNPILVNNLSNKMDIQGLVVSDTDMKNLVVKDQTGSDVFTVLLSIIET